MASTADANKAHSDARWAIAPHSGRVDKEDKSDAVILAGFVYIGDSILLGMGRIAEALEKLKKAD